MVCNLRTDHTLYRYVLGALERSTHLAMPTGTVFYRLNRQCTVWLSPLRKPIVCVPCTPILCAGIDVSSRWWANLGRARYVGSAADAVALLLELTG